MRDRDAERAALDTMGHWGAIVDLLVPARARLVEYDAAGYPSGVGESSIGSNGKSDPVAQAIDRTVILAKADPDNPGVERRQVGWRPIDEYATQRRDIDRRLQRLHDDTRDLRKELEQIVRTYEGPAEEGCWFCDALRLPINDETGRAEHRCDDGCADRAHRPPNSHQKIYTRRAPKAPAEATEEELERYETLRDLPRCSFHHDFAARYGVDAAQPVGLWHLDHPGERTPYALIKQHHKAEFDRHHSNTTIRQSDRVWLGGTNT